MSTLLVKSVVMFNVVLYISIGKSISHVSIYRYTCICRRDLYTIVIDLNLAGILRLTMSTMLKINTGCIAYGFYPIKSKVVH